MKVAIVGLSPSHDLAPWDDPSWQKWGVAWDADRVSLDRAFDIHEDWRNAGPEHAEKLADCDRLYMVNADLPNSVRYPLEEVIGTCGDYFESSVALMFGLAIHEGAEEIGLWGVDMKSGEEHGYQKPNMEYLIGLARGKGIKVHIHESSPLCKHSGQFGYIKRYGWLG